MVLQFFSPNGTFVNHYITSSHLVAAVCTCDKTSRILNNLSVWLTHVPLFVVCKQAFLAKLFLDILGLDDGFHTFPPDIDMDTITITKSLPKVKDYYVPIAERN